MIAVDRGEAFGPRHHVVFGDRKKVGTYLKL